MAKKRYDHLSEEDFLIQIRTRQSRIPNCECLQNSVIKKGAMLYKVASVLQFRNSETGGITHRELHLNDYPFRRGTGVKWEVKDRLRHWACKDDEIERLKGFLHAIDESIAPRDYTVIEGRTTTQAREYLKLLEGV